MESGNVMVVDHFNDSATCIAAVVLQDAETRLILLEPDAPAAEVDRLADYVFGLDSVPCYTVRLLPP
jgi:hypothetical protein